MKLSPLIRHQVAILKLGRDLVANQPPGLVLFQTGCANIVNNPQMFPDLGCGKHQRRRLFTSANRERRPERLAMMARVLAVHGAHADLLTLSNGRRVNGVCKPITELQIAREVGIDAGEDDLTHDTRGMRAVRSAERDLADAGWLSRKQPRVQYCSSGAGGCGKTIERGGTCKCGRRHCWRWRALPSVHTIQKRAVHAIGGDFLVEQIEREQGERYRDLQLGKVGPEPEIDVRLMREHRRMLRAQHRRRELATAADQAEQLGRLFPDEKPG